MQKSVRVLSVVLALLVTTPSLFAQDSTPEPLPEPVFVGYGAGAETGLWGSVPKKGQLPLAYLYLLARLNVDLEVLWRVDEDFSLGPQFSFAFANLSYAVNFVDPRFRLVGRWDRQDAFVHAFVGYNFGYAYSMYKYDGLVPPRRARFAGPEIGLRNGDNSRYWETFFSFTFGIMPKPEVFWHFGVGWAPGDLAPGLHRGLASLQTPLSEGDEAPGRWRVDLSYGLTLVSTEGTQGSLKMFNRIGVEPTLYYRLNPGLSVGASAGLTVDPVLSALALIVLPFNPMMAPGGLMQVGSSVDFTTKVVARWDLGSMSVQPSLGLVVPPSGLFYSPTPEANPWGAETALRLGMGGAFADVAAVWRTVRVGRLFQQHEIRPWFHAGFGWQTDGLLRW